MNIRISGHVSFLVSSVLLAISGYAMAMATYEYTQSLGTPGLSFVFAVAVILFEIGAWILWPISYHLGKSKRVIVAGVFFIVALAYETFSGFVHYDFFYSAITQGQVNASVEMTTGRMQRAEKRERLVRELDVLGQKVEAPDYGLASVNEAIAAAMRDSGVFAEKGSTTNARMIYENTIQPMLEKRAGIEEQRIAYVNKTTQENNARRSQIQSEIDALDSAEIIASKNVGRGKTLNENSAHIVSMLFALFLKVIAMVCSLAALAIKFDRTKEQASSAPGADQVQAVATSAVMPSVATPVAQEPELPEEVFVSSVAVSHPAPMVSVPAREVFHGAQVVPEQKPSVMTQPTAVPEPVRREASCAPVSASSVAVDRLIAVVTDQSAGLATESEVPEEVELEAPAEAVAGGSQESEDADAHLLDGLPEGDVDAFKGMLQMIKSHPADRPFPRKEFPVLLKELLGPNKGACGSHKTNRLFEHAVAKGLLEKRGVPFYVVC